MSVEILNQAWPRWYWFLLYSFCLGLGWDLGDAMASWIGLACQ